MKQYPEYIKNSLELSRKRKNLILSWTKDFIEKEIQMAQICVKRCTSSLTIRDMKNYPTDRQKISLTILSVGEDIEDLELLYIFMMGVKLEQLLP